MLPVDHPIRTQLCSPFPITHNSPLFPDIPSHTQRHAYQRHYQRSNRRKNVKKETAYHLKQSSTEKKNVSITFIYPGIIYTIGCNRELKDKKKKEKKEKGGKEKNAKPQNLK